MSRYHYRKRSEPVVRALPRRCNDITIAVPEHSITALIGPSGCGKSTFLKTLNRMNDLIPGVKMDGRGALQGTGHLRPRRGRQPAAP